MTRAASYAPATARSALLAHQVLRDRDLLNLRRPAPQLHQHRVAREPLHLILFHVAVAAENVDRLHRDLRRRLAAEELAGADVRHGHADLPAGEEVGEDEVP